MPNIIHPIYFLRILYTTNMRMMASELLNHGVSIKSSLAAFHIRNSIPTVGQLGSLATLLYEGMNIQILRIQKSCVGYLDHDS